MGNFERSQESYWKSISGIGIGSKIPETVPWPNFLFHNNGIVGQGILRGVKKFMWSLFLGFGLVQYSRNDSVAKFCFSQYGYRWTKNFKRSSEIYVESISGTGIDSKIPETVLWLKFVFWVSLDREF
ncbi:hypothetical protein ACFFRR_003278 [Megaselia abdita]